MPAYAHLCGRQRTGSDTREPAMQCMGSLPTHYAGPRSSATSLQLTELVAMLGLTGNVLDYLVGDRLAAPAPSCRRTPVVRKRKAAICSLTLYFSAISDAPMPRRAAK